ncbi:MAG: hypothetical protein FWG10_00560 [Eubacteriaceae bacterium]|nr:hypothetical protein [Eubacteriaceae bacterium]
MLFTEFNIDIAKEVWQEEACEEARKEAREERKKWQGVVAGKDAEIADKDAEISRLRALLGND